MKHLILSACLGVAALAASACSHAEDADRPPVLKTLEARGLTVVDEFEVGDGLRGFAGVVRQQPVAVYVTESGDAIVGTRVSASGDERDAAQLQTLVSGPMGERMWEQLESADWVRDGQQGAPKVVYTFSDPNCPFCNRFWQAARPWIDAGKVELRHVMVGVIRQDSAGKVAAILTAPDPSAKLAENERSFGQGGVAPVEVPPGIRSQLDANEALMVELGFGGTPAIVYRDASGAVQRHSGMPQGDSLQAILGPL